MRIARRVSVLTFLLLATYITLVTAQQVQYEVEKQWILIWVNQDGSIDLQYNLTIRCVSGSLGYYLIGQPNEHFVVLNSTDLDGRALDTESIIEDGNYQVRVNLASRIRAGESATVLLLTRVERMIWEDRTNPGNVGMQFLATYWPVTVANLRIGVVLPSGVLEDEIRNDPPRDNLLQYQSSLMVYWERSYLEPNEQFNVGVSFPEQYVSEYFTEGLDLAAYLPLIIVGSVITAAAIPAAVLLRRKEYIRPAIGIEALGVRRGLTAVEAASLLGVDPRRILVMVVFSLMRRDALKATREPGPDALPSGRLVLAQTQGVDLKNLRWYEIDFLRCMHLGGELDEEALATLIRQLRDTVNQKLRGYCREDTIEHYRSIVEKAWEQVESAGTPELVAQSFAEQLDWLSLDPRLRERSEEIAVRFPGHVMPGYWWPLYIPVPRQERLPPPPTQTSRPAHQPIPITEFANSAVLAIEQTSNSIVTNIERFMTMSAPKPPSPSTKAAVRHRSGCVCACASCACACACVSCACACASGGAG